MATEARQFTDWLAAYGRSWAEGDPEQIISLFTADARYYETPFAEPMRGHDAIRAYWTAGAQEAQRDVHFEATVLAFADNVGLAHWRASFIRVPSGIQVELDGILQVTLDGNGRCTIFREWWHRKEQ